MKWRKRKGKNFLFPVENSPEAANVKLYWGKNYTNHLPFFLLSFIIPYSSSLPFSGVWGWSWKKKHRLWSNNEIFLSISFLIQTNLSLSLSPYPRTGTSYSYSLIPPSSGRLRLGKWRIKFLNLKTKMGRNSRKHADDWLETNWPSFSTHYSNQNWGCSTSLFLSFVGKKRNN